MKKHILLLTLMVLVLGAGRCMAQFENFEDNNANIRGGGSGDNGGNRAIDHLRFSGNFGIGFAGGNFAVNFDPCVGWAFNKYVTLGVIATCEYFKYGDSYYNDSYSQSILGGGVYAEAYPLDFLVVHGEFQKISYKDYYNSSVNPDRISENIALIGGGYHWSISERSGCNLMILWNLNVTDGIRNNTSFSNPIFRFNIVF